MNPLKGPLKLAVAAELAGVLAAVERSAGALNFGHGGLLQIHAERISERVCGAENFLMECGDCSTLGADMFTFNISYTGESKAQHEEVLKALAELRGDVQELKKKMAELDDDLTAIDAATTQMAGIISDQTKTLQTISTEMDTLITAVQNGTVTPAQLTKAKQLITSQSVVIKNLQDQAAFSTQIAAKGNPTPVPGPVPTPTPVPPPAP